MNYNLTVKDFTFIKEQMIKALAANEEKLEKLQNKLKAYEFKAYFYKKLISFLDSNQSEDYSDTELYINSVLIESVFEKARTKFSKLSSNYAGKSDKVLENEDILKTLPDISEVEKLIAQKSGKDIQDFQAVPLQILNSEQYNNEPEETKKNFQNFANYYDRINKYVNKYESDLKIQKDLNSEQLQLNAIIRAINI